MHPAVLYNNSFSLSLDQKSQIWWETHWKTKEKSHNWFRFVNGIYQILVQLWWLPLCSLY